MKPRHRLSLAPLAGLLLATAGCSTQAWYEGMRQRAQNDCYRQPPGAQQDCLSRVNKTTYDRYEQERAAHKP